ncbi:PEP/pyruvate-binding domain-containing protein [Streptomyces sp. ME109]|uniref:PEP/pyruvate-binding domain-containing protein n=1 Tax=Streptomyces sp. me109 TaxID=1827853 RepID=UPI0016516CBE|nr:PEP/pyruvate-binding domain-containing protein [Streptomyces sp. me109]
MTHGTVFADTASESSDPTLVGHKFARQAQLRAAGYNVPEFVCVPVDAFDRAMETARPDIPEAPVGGSPDELAEWAEKAAAAVLRVGVPESLTNALLSRFDHLAGDAGVVAVRSCAVPLTSDTEQDGEDSAADPFAGLGRSFLSVGRAELPDALAACWASAFTPEGVLYRARRGADPTATRMAVGVQRLVPATASFVAFSRDPRGGRNAEESLIAAAYGLGEGVAQEQADVDHFTVHVATGAVVPQLVRKERQVVAGPTGGTVLADVPGELADRPVLDDRTARAVADLALALERHFDMPQDIEGAVTEDGEIHLVQARPAVVAAAPRDRRELHWSNGNISESYAGHTSMLTFSVASELYAVGFEEFYRSMGVPERTLRARRYELRRMLGYVDGRVYMRLESWYRLHSGMRAFIGLKHKWEKAVVTVDSSVTVPAPSGPRRMAVRAREIPAAGVRRLLNPRRMRAFFAWWDDRRDGLPDPETRSPGQLVQDYRELWADVALYWGRTLVANTHVIAELDLAERLMRRWAPDANRGVLNGMLCDGPVNRSVLALRSLLTLADTVGGHAEALAAVFGDDRTHEEHDDTDVWRRLAGGAFGDDLAAMATAHVKRYGDRGLHDLKLETTVVSQRPQMLLPQLRPVITSGRSTQDSAREERRARREAESELRTHCAGPLRLALLRLLFWSLRRNLFIRENARFCRTELFGASRRMIRSLGRHLVDAGRLDSVDDVNDLTVEEILGAYEGGAATVGLRELAAVRAKARAASLRRADPPNIFATDADLPLDVALESSGSTRGTPGSTLTGLASSGGVVRGRARVVTEPDVDPESCRDRILIARETDPGWMFLMLVAKGLVAERGTVLSHMAITGRIFGVPTVVAVHGVVDRVPDGALIEVDGDRGTITVLDETTAEDAS